ncbi:MAG TPA: hypothetical protein VMU39_17725 [Solirubrobacteraceae bacterium]|nr:hypothetical protein [Solirubrobacteraceae bacterium]
MWPFRRRRGGNSGDDLPSPAGLGAFARANGWEAVGDERPFDGHLEDGVHRVTCAIHRVPSNTVMAGIRVGNTIFRDSYRTTVNGRTVIVSNGWTNIQTEVQHAPDHWRGVAVCAAELPSVLPLARISPRDTGAELAVSPSPTSNPEFDRRFVVSAPPDAALEVLTPPVQQQIMARDDWFFWIERYLFGCISPGAFTSVEDVRERIDAVLRVIAAIPTSVLPDHVDHAADDLIARISRLTSMEEAMTMLQHLTPTERDQLATSDTPLAAFADVRSPQEAMARFKTLDQQRKMQLLAMFMRVKDAQRNT